MNGLSAFLQQAFDILRTQAAALWNVVSAIIANKPEPARNVVLYTAALVVLSVLVLPKIAKLIISK